MSAQPPSMTTAERKLSLAAILSSAFGIGIAIGFSIPLISLFMERLGYGNTVIGMNAATAALSVLVCGPWVASLASRLGTVTTLLLGNALAATGLVAFAFFTAAGPLFVLRALIGFGAALGWIVTETWISLLPSERWRGRVIALYAILFSLGVSMGPVMLNLVGSHGARPFLVCAGLLIASGIPAVMVYRHAPPIGEKNQRVRIRYALRLAPVGVMTGLLCGIAEQSLLGLLSLWGLGIGLSTSNAVFLTTLFAVGGVVLMLPVGWLSDRADRFNLLIGVVVLGTLCTAALPLLAGSEAALFTVVLALGGAVAAFYVLGLTLIGETSTTRNADLVSLNTVFIMAYTVGMVIGPVAAGGGMDIWPPHGLMMVLTGLFAVFIPAAYWFRRRLALSYA
ncbi:MAG TPA: MFS transporter [Arenicellales bacterium]|nr:MFS transporter [Arenicellales bacterium]